MPSPPQQVISARKVASGSDLLSRAAPLFDALRGERWLAPHPAASGLVGVQRSRRRGSALEFTEYRLYRQGDDPRRLDWKLLARTDRAYVRITDDHAVMATTFVVDASASMGFPTATLAKWRSAQLITLALAFVASAQGDPVALTIVGEPTVRRQLRTRRGMLAELAAALSEVTPSGSTPLAPVFTDFAGQTRRRVVIASDFLGDDLDTLARARALAASGVAVHAVHVVAREELTPPEQATLVADPEDLSLRRPLTRDTRAAYLGHFAQWRSTLRQAWQTAGASYVMAVTDQPTDRIVRDIIRLPPGRS